MEIEFLTIEDALLIHADQITRYGGAPGLRERGLLLSAIAMPASGFGGRFAHQNLFEMAAAYLFHIVQNHPFIDGNKRTGVAAALVFLELNGVSVRASNAALAELVFGVARGERRKADIAAFFEAHAG